MSKFKVGDRVKALEKGVDITEGKIYGVVEDTWGDICVLDDVGDKNCINDDSKWELVNEGPFYVLALPQVPYKTLEEAEADLKARATEYHQTTYGIFKGVKAMKLVTEVQEVPFYV